LKVGVLVPNWWQLAHCTVPLKDWWALARGPGEICAGAGTQPKKTNRKKMERGIANGLMGQIREEALFAVGPLKYTNPSLKGI
jgi:hypothetical protein